MLNPPKSRRLVAMAWLACAPAALGDDADAPIPVPVGSVEVRDLPAITADIPPLTLTLPSASLASAPVGTKSKKHAAKAAARAAYVGGPLVLNEGPATLNLSVPAPKDLSSGASFNLDLPAAAVKAEASASVGKEDGQSAFWHKDTAGVQAQISGPMGTALDAAGENKLSLTYREPESVGSSDAKAHVVRTESQSEHASLSVPISPVRLTVGGDSTTERTQQGAPGDPTSFTQSAVRTDNHAAYVDVEWQPVDGVQLKGGTAARVAAISWQNAHSSTYRSLDPNITATVAPFRDTTVTTKLEQTVAPYDAAAFANYATADKKVDASGFEPDHAWQLQTRIEQRVGDASLSATYTAARQGTVTEFADVGGTQAPSTTPLLGRDSVAVAVRLPLTEVGLPQTDITSEATWQTSRVVDPVTYQTRTASGEAGQKLSLKLSHSLPTQNLSIGVTGEYTGARTSYQVNELSTTEPGGSLGAFVSYKPGNYEVNLNVNGLVGATTRDDFYRGMRGSSEIGHTLWQDNSGPTLKLELKRPF